MSVKFTLKVADESDSKCIEEVGDSLFDHPIKLDRLNEFMADERHLLVLAYSEGNIIGMASGFTYVHPDKDTALFVNEVGVLDHLQGQGVGSSLVEFLCEHAQSIGCHEAWVATEYTNLKARAAFKKAGGTESPEIVSLITYSLGGGS